MGAKTWMLVYANGEVAEMLTHNRTLDRGATLQLAREVFPKEKLDPIGDGSLLDTCPADDEVYLGSFGGCFDFGCQGIRN